MAENNIKNDTDGRHVNIFDSEDLTYWVKRLKTNRNRLIIAVHTVGTLASDVERWLAENL